MLTVISEQPSQQSSREVRQTKKREDEKAEVAGERGREYKGIAREDGWCLCLFAGVTFSVAAQKGMRATFLAELRVGGGVTTGPCAFGREPATCKLKDGGMTTEGDCRVNPS